MIFCLEDDSSIRELMLYTLKTAGYAAQGFETAAAFWEAMKDAKPELILLDIMLPDADGIEVLRKLRGNVLTAELPIIMATAKGTEYDKVLGLDTGADDYGVMENHLEREEIRAALDTGFGESTRYSATLMERSLYCARRLSDGTVLRLSAAHGSILLLLLGMTQPILIIVAVVLILAFVLANRLSKSIVEPLNRLDLDAPQSSEGYAELAPLLNRIDLQQKQLSRMDAHLKEKEAQLEKLESIRREFTANVSHELKTPLQSISGYSELLKCGIARPEDVRSFHEKIYHEAQRLIALVEDIISLSHLDEGGQALQWADVDLYAVSGSVTDKLSDIAAQQGITLTLEGQSAVVHAVPELVHTMIYNLCDNAIKYNRPGGAVLVRVSGSAVLVRDTGIGISAQHLDRIFERFYRVDKSRSKAVGGTGLGLSIVKHAAIIHHAEIAVESTVGEGTAITIRFPAHS